MDLITIGITCFNAQESVENAVQSARTQTWPSIEIVVVDDHSSDGSWPVLERLAADDPRIHIVRHDKNQGVAASRNTVLERAAGAFVAFFDDDDVSRPERLAVQHARILDYERETGAKTVVCYSATRQVFPGGETRYSPTLGMDVTPAPAGEDVARLILLGRPVGRDTGICPTSSQMARREVYELVGGFDDSFRRHEDTDLNLRLALKGGHFAGISKPLVLQTVTTTGDKVVDIERRYAHQLIERNRELLKRWNWYEFSSRWTEMKYATLDGGVKSAAPHFLKLLVSSPLKFTRKLTWALSHRDNYKRFVIPQDKT